MKLLFVHQNLGALGGAEANIQITANELRQRGHTVALLHGSGTGQGEQAFRETFSETFPLSGANKTETAIAALNEFGPDVIYLHNLADLGVIEALLNAGVPVVRMVHDHAMYCMRGHKTNVFTRNICTRPASLYCVFPCGASISRNRQGPLPVSWVSYAAKRKEIRLNQQCQRLIVFSEYCKEELIGNGFEPDKIQIHRPILCRGNSGPVSSFSARNLLLFAGQIIRGKGVDLLLKSLALVKEPFECLILGEGSHRSCCERLCAKLGLQNKVKFGGYVPRQQLNDFYLDSSAFLVSSVWPEPFGLVGPEAMRYGLPVVAFDAGGVREWLTDGENGFLVPRMDTTRFAARIEELLRNKDLARQMGRRGLERVNRDYDSVRQIDTLETLFLRVIDEAQVKAGNIPAHNYSYELCPAN
ncbi:MAG: hypothetical protein QOJ40_2668 [Verrucomicrobiota bacterium]